MGECIHVDEFCHIQSCIAHTHTCAPSVWDPSKLLLSMYTWFWSTCISNVLNLPYCAGFFPQGQGFYFTIQDMLKTDTGNDLKAMRGSGGRKSFILEGTCFQESLCLVSRQQKANLFDKEGLRDLWRLKISYIYPHIYIHPYIPRQVWENNFFFLWGPWFWQRKSTGVAHLVLFVALLSYDQSLSLIFSTLFFEATEGYPSDLHQRSSGFQNIS